MTSRITAVPGSLWSALGSASHAGVLLRGTAGSLAVKVAANGLLFVSQIVFARYLGVDAFGLYVLALAWLSILVLLGRVGFDLATVRYVAAYAGDGEWGLLRGFLAAGHITVTVGSLVVGGLFAAGVMLVLPADAGPMRDVLLLAALATWPLALIQLQAAAVRGLGHVVMGDVPFSVVHPTLLIVFFLVAILWFGTPPSAMLALSAYLGASLAAMAWLWPMLRGRMPAEAGTAPRQYRWREWLTTAPAMILTAGFAVVLNQSAVMMVGALAGPAEAGLLGAAARIAGVMQILIFSLVAAIAPMIARLHAAGENAALQASMDTGLRVVFSAGLAVAILLAFIGEWVLSLFGEAFTAAQGALMILLAAQVVCAATAAAASVLNMTGNQNASALILLVASVVNLGLCWGLIPTFGLTGAAAAAAVALAGSNIAMAMHARRVTGLRSHVSLPGPARSADGMERLS